MLSKEQNINAYLHDAMIEAYASMFSDSALILSQQVVTDIFINGYSYDRKVINFFKLQNWIKIIILIIIIKYDLTKYDQICGLVLINVNHWNCFCANMYSNEFVYIDPFGANKEQIDNALDKWR